MSDNVPAGHTPGAVERQINETAQANGWVLGDWNGRPYPGWWRRSDSKEACSVTFTAAGQIKSATVTTWPPITLEATGVDLLRDRLRRSLGPGRLVRVLAVLSSRPGEAGEAAAAAVSRE